MHATVVLGRVFFACSAKLYTGNDAPFTIALSCPTFPALRKNDGMLVHVVLKGGGLLKPYTSFAEYALETSKSSEPLPLPLVTPLGQRSLMSIPLITIIGVQVTYPTLPLPGTSNCTSIQTQNMKVENRFFRSVTGFTSQNVATGFT